MENRKPQDENNVKPKTPQPSDKKSDQSAGRSAEDKDRENRTRR